MTQTAKIEIEIEARTAKAVQGMQNLAAATARARTEAGKTAVAFGSSADATSKSGNAAAEASSRVAAFGAAADKAAEAARKQATAMTGGSKVTAAFASSVKQLETGQASLRQSVMGVAAAFGPLGIAVGVAGSALIGWIGEQREAAAAAALHTAELKKQAREMADAAAAAARAQRVERMNSKFFADAATDAKHEYQAFLESTKEERDILEETIALQEGRGKNVSALRTREAEMRAEALREEADLVRGIAHGDDVAAAHVEAERLEQEAINVLRTDKLRIIRDEGAAEKAITSEKQKQHDLVFEAGLAQARAGKNARFLQRDGSDTREFESERRAAANQRVGSQFGNTEFDKDAAAEAEKKRLAALEDARKAADDAAKKRHQEEMERLKEQQARYERTGAAIGDTVAGLAATWLQAGDLSARGFAKALQSWGKAESIKLAGIAISEGVQALVSLATFNFPGAAAHGAAAGAAAAGAAAIAALVGATGGFGSISKNPKGGFGADAFGPGNAFGDSSANDRPSVSNSQTDTTPVSPGEAAQHTGKGKPTGGSVTNVYHFNAIGTIDENAARRIAQGMQRAGRTGGRLTG